jgi:methylphosphotriester-DNA--protein-cysteine methyltransferase
MWNQEDMKRYSQILDEQETAVLEAVFDHGFEDFEQVRVYAELKLSETDTDYLRSVYNLTVNPGKVHLNVE